MCYIWQYRKCQTNNKKVTSGYRTNRQSIKTYTENHPRRLAGVEKGARPITKKLHPATGPIDKALKHTLKTTLEGLQGLKKPIKFFLLILNSNDTVYKHKQMFSWFLVPQKTACFHLIFMLLFLFRRSRGKMKCHCLLNLPSYA